MIRMHGRADMGLWACVARARLNVVVVVVVVVVFVLEHLPPIKSDIISNRVKTRLFCLQLFTVRLQQFLASRKNILSARLHSHTHTQQAYIRIRIFIYAVLFRASDALWRNFCLGLIFFFLRLSFLYYYRPSGVSVCCACCGWFFFFFLFCYLYLFCQFFGTTIFVVWIDFGCEK